jgi:hypothetical protein
MGKGYGLVGNFAVWGTGFLFIGYGGIGAGNLNGN